MSFLVVSVGSGSTFPAELGTWVLLKGLVRLARELQVGQCPASLDQRNPKLAILRLPWTPCIRWNLLLRDPLFELVDLAV